MSGSKSRSYSWSLKANEPIFVVGTIRSGEAASWLVESTDLPFPMQLEGLDAQFQHAGLRVTLTVHVEDDRVATHAPWMLLFVDHAQTA